VERAQISLKLKLNTNY